MTHLGSYPRPHMSFQNPETGTLVEISNDPDWNIAAFEIDVMVPGSYFGTLYGGLSERPPSADGLLLTRHRSGRIEAVVILEVKARAEHISRAAAQLRETAKHFCIGTQDPQLSDDGDRHHRWARHRNLPVSQKDHFVIGVFLSQLVSRKVRTEEVVPLHPHKNLYLLALDTRAPALSYTMREIWEECVRRFGLPRP